MSDRAQKILKYFHEEKEFVEARVKGGIELYRKGTAKIRIVDENGNPIKGAVIDAKEVKQEFKFGANIFMLEGFDTEEENQLFKTKFLELFNLATLPFYWKDVEPEEGKLRFDVNSPWIYRRPPIDLCIDFCLKNGVEPKLHCLNYSEHHAPWAAVRSINEIKELMIKRFREIGERYAKIIPKIEVTNETFVIGNRDYHNPFFYEDDYVEWSFREAQKYFPANELIINDADVIWDSVNAHTNRNPYYMQIERMLRQNVPIHGIGMQYHNLAWRREDEAAVLVKPDGRYNPRHLCAVMDKFAELNLPMQITEMTIPSYSWDPEDEAVQAEILKNVYSLFFAQKNMEAIIYWDMPDGYAAASQPRKMDVGWNVFYGNLLHPDLTEKEGFKVLKKLIREEWVTNTQIVTDENGYSSLRGFHGEYIITIHANDKTVTKAMNLSSKRHNNYTFVI